MKLLGLKKCTLLLCVSCGIAVIILSTRKPLQLNDVWIPFPVFSNVSGHVQQVTPRNAAPSSTSTCGAMFDQKKWKTPYQVWSTNGYIRYNWAQEKHDFNTMPTKIVLNMSIDSSQTFIKEAFLSHHPNIRYNKSSLSKYQLTVPDCQIGEWHSSVKIFQECLSNRLVVSINNECVVNNEKVLFLPFRNAVAPSGSCTPETLGHGTNSTPPICGQQTSQSKRTLVMIIHSHYVLT